MANCATNSDLVLTTHQDQTVCCLGCFCIYCTLYLYLYFLYPNICICISCTPYLYLYFLPPLSPDYMEIICKVFVNCPLMLSVSQTSCLDSNSWSSLVIFSFIHCTELEFELFLCVLRRICGMFDTFKGLFYITF